MASIPSLIGSVEQVLVTRTSISPIMVIGFRCINMGFSVPRLEVPTCPGDRTTEHEMPMNPPQQTEMWLFVDTKGDFGVPQIHDPDTEYGTRFVGHNDDFHNYYEGEIPAMPDRLQIWDKQVLLEVGRSCNTYDHTKKEYTIKDPSQIYDFTRHPGYKELSASDATAFAMDFTPGPGQQFNMFPHRQVADMNGIRGSTGVRFSTVIQTAVLLLEADTMASSAMELIIFNKVARVAHHVN
ncbi:hypothetical protein PoB_004495900 [Plakobranchus ocellatus]|uniref:Uncharacterized protein n=1 Tax=Plakobranchus ocellatus TaxID=259542 RepID=A0AAV4BEA4_9GAST|nr:hypothetical protein PoB_004495900 [Plakobranchus ocellatus]